jgi:hypothetical protein
MRLTASRQDSQQPPVHMLETTSRAEFVPHNLEGIE